MASVVLAPGAAWACEEHDPEERERVAGPAGHTVSLEIPSTLEGAEWAIRVEHGDELAKGEDETAEQGVEAEFEVPDLGQDERSVDLVVAVTHEADGADWSYEVELEYGGRPAPDPPRQAEPGSAPAPTPGERPPPPRPERSSDATPSPAPAASAPPPAPAASATPPAPPAPATPAQRASSAPPPSAPPPSAPTAPVFPAGKELSPGGDLRDGITAVRTVIPAAVAGGDRTRRAADAHSRSRARRRARRPVPQAPAAAPVRPRRHQPAPDGGVRLPDVDLPGLGSGLAWSLIGAGGLAFALTGLGVAGLGRHRRRRGRRVLSSPV